ncbi:MAG: symmetrical bis(5'-nucleosyl)-tetraphosphatase [Pseudomonadales bacterium]
MSTYAVGDIHGCFTSLRALLAEMKFNPKRDTLWCCGDLINRGPKNVETLELLMALPNLKVTLGNHDLHFLAISEGIATVGGSDTISDLLDHPRLPEFKNWLRAQSLLVVDPSKNIVMTHAGLPEIWNIKQATQIAEEIETHLRGANWQVFLKNMYGNDPTTWRDDLETTEHLRLATNILTRMRYYRHSATFEFHHKGSTAPAGFEPWFNYRHPELREITILFGHWAALGGVRRSDLAGLDTGCVYGRSLTALRLEDKTYFSVPSQL